MDIKSCLGFKAEVRGKDDCALAPFLDMLNHSCNAKVCTDGLHNFYSFGLVAMR